MFPRMMLLRNLRTRNPLQHALLWIALYVAAVFVGDALSELIGVENSATAVILLVLSAFLVLYLKSDRLLDYYGIRGISLRQARLAWFYVPLALIVLLQFTGEIDHGMGAGTVFWIVLLMLGVGFVEEVIFRGFLFKAILERGTLMRAVVISGVTFGIGHIVNLGRGYTLSDQLLQIAAAVVIGMVLVLLFAVTGSIIPGVLFHMLYNIIGSSTTVPTELGPLLVAATVVVCCIYAVPLVRHLRRLESAGSTV